MQLLVIVLCASLLASANALSLAPQRLRHSKARTAALSSAGASSLGEGSRSNVFARAPTGLRSSRGMSKAMSADSEHNQDLPPSTEVVGGSSSGSSGSSGFNYQKVARIALPAVAITALSLLYGQPAMAATSELYESLKAQVNDSGFLQVSDLYCILDRLFLYVVEIQLDTG